MKNKITIILLGGLGLAFSTTLHAQQAKVQDATLADVIVYGGAPGDRISCTIDDKEVGSLRSPGIAHDTKTWVRLLVPKSISIDDVKFWRKSHGSE